MIKTLLLDLDGTLLPVETEDFIQKYLELVAVKLSEITDPTSGVKHLLSSTKHMIENKNPNLTNKEVFVKDFTSRVRCSENIIMKLFHSFYTNEYKSLKKCVKNNREINKIISILNDKKLELVLATNPVFPQAAVKERLRWINAHNLPFKLVCSYENMHFCKPHIEYYEEILSLVQKNPEECLMVGNDTREDLAAKKIGIKTFLIENYLINNTPCELQPDYKGNYTDFITFLKQLLTIVYKEVRV